MKRLAIDGAGTWHVMSRAVRRLELYRDDTDYRAFLDRLDAAAVATGVVPLAYALMPNHYHLLVNGTTAALGDAMHRVNRSYARAYNTRHEQGGHVFEGAYKAFLMRGDWRIVHASRYIHLNPVAARLGKRPGDWRWSSYGAYTGGKADLRSLRANTVVDLAGGRADYANAMAEAQDAMPKKHPTHSPEALWETQARWILARVTAQPLEGVDAKALALHIASEAGVPPRVSAGVLGFSSPLYASIVTTRWGDRLGRDAKFAAAVKEWKQQNGM